jgi:hypothetical protein
MWFRRVQKLSEERSALPSAGVDFINRHPQERVVVQSIGIP